jgi:hypothetical protein
MSISELIDLMEKKLTALNGARATAFALGDVAQVVAIDGQISQTQLTLDALRSL